MQAHGFRYSFTPLPAVLFTFPSRYLCAIGLPGVLSLGGWCRRFRTGFLRPRPTQGADWVRFGFAYGAVTRCGPPSQARSATSALPSRPPYNPARASTPAVWAGPLSLAATRGVTVVLLSSAYLDVSVRRVRLHQRWMPQSPAAGFPIRTPADHWLFAPPRGLSRPPASFFASGSLGIPRAPYGTCRVPRPSAALRGGWLSMCSSCLSCGRIAAPAMLVCSRLSFHPVKEPGEDRASLSWRARESNP